VFNFDLPGQDAKTLGLTVVTLMVRSECEKPVTDFARCRELFAERKKILEHNAIPKPEGWDFFNV
jgi:hypothetical protein